MSEQKFKFTVAMTCEGCSNAVKKNLGKLGDKVTNIETNWETKTVIVTSTVESDEILAQLKKTGLETSFVGAA